MKIRSMALVSALSLAVLGAGGAQAATVLSDNFDSENGGATALNYTGFANWTVLGTGTVDIVAMPDYGITCAGGSGSCVDLDGSTSEGAFISTSSFSFAAGDTVTFSFDLSGNQRTGGSDNFAAGFNFGGPTLLASYSTGGGFGVSTPFTNFTTGGLGTWSSVTGFQPFGSYSVSFVAGQAGTFWAAVGTDSADNIGPILDNASLTITSPRSAVPEPATWALMIAGIGMAGAGLRRRRVLA